MKNVQIPFSFRATIHRAPRTGFDLIGRSYAEDRRVTVTVIGLCQKDLERVLVRRRPGRVFSMPAWLIRAILREDEKKMKHRRSKKARMPSSYDPP
jgi:hypothetical protein